MSGIDFRVGKTEYSETCNTQLESYNEISTVVAILTDLIDEDDADTDLGLSSIRDFEGMEASAILLFIAPWDNFKTWMEKLDIDRAVAHAIKEWESIGIDQINFMLNAAEVLPQEKVLESLRLFAQEVMPAFTQETR